MRQAVIVLLTASFVQSPVLGSETWLTAPFANRSADSSSDWIGESLSEVIREELARRRISVVPRRTREAAAVKLSLRRTLGLPLAALVKLSEETGAGRIIYGEFDVLPAETEAGSPTLRLTAKVLDARQIASLGEVSLQGPLEQIAALQADLAWQVLRLAGTDPGPREQFDNDSSKVKLTALENYIRGLIAEDPDTRHRFFAQAARLDEGFFQPRYQLGRIQWERENYREAARWLERIPPTALLYSQALFFLGVSRFEIADYAGSGQAFQNLASLHDAPELWNNLGAAQLGLNRPAEALVNFRKALAATPSDPDYHFNVGYALWKLGEFDAAAALFQSALERAPSDAEAANLLARCRRREGPRPGDLTLEGLERVNDTWEAPSTQSTDN